MEVKLLRLEGLLLLTPKIFPDNRGYFFESYHKPRYEALGVACDFVQDNHSFSKQGTIRGLHFQSEPGQAKLIRVGSGRIFDVAVDIRPSSQTFGEWEGVYLDSESHQQLFIPVGFAHGFCVVSEEALVLYKVSTPYDPKTETGFRADDPDIAIEWPLGEPILSERDLKSPFFKDLIL